MEFPIFSKRHKKALKSGQISINLSTATKQRILYAMEEFNDEVWHTTETGFNYSTTFLTDLGKELCSEHGWKCLKAFVPGKNEMNEVKVPDFIRFGAPHYIFDAIEMFSGFLAEAKYPFQKEINKIFTDSQLPWILSDHLMFHIDSQYMGEVFAAASQLLSTQGFGGAMQEFQKARSHLDSGDYKVAIHHANLALESTMKTILGIDRAKPGELLQRTIDSGIIPAYYDEFLKNFKQILRTVNIARNEEKGAGHGQGAQIAEVPPHLAEMVLNFCGALIIFLVKHHIDSQSPAEPVAEEEVSLEEDEMPF